MARKSNCVKIDGKRLKDFLHKKNISLREASISCGFEDSYFSMYTRNNKLPAYAIKLLESVYDIDLSDFIMPIETVNSQTIVDDRKITLSENTLTQIYLAVYEAMKRALTE